MSPQVRTRRPFSDVEQAALDDFLGSDVGLGLFFDRKARPIGMIQAGQLKWEQPGYERIGHSWLVGRLGAVEVSTVWLGMDHGWRGGPPIIFETMIFCDDDELNLSCWRYSTVKDAQIGHRRVVKLVKLLQRYPKVLAKPHKNRGRHWR